MCNSLGGILSFLDVHQVSNHPHGSDFSVFFGLKFSPVCSANCIFLVDARDWPSDIPSTSSSSRPIVQHFPWYPPPWDSWSSSFGITELTTVCLPASIALVLSSTVSGSVSHQSAIVAYRASPNFVNVIPSLCRPPRSSSRCRHPLIPKRGLVPSELVARGLVEYEITVVLRLS